MKYQEFEEIIEKAVAREWEPLRLRALERTDGDERTVHHCGNSFAAGFAAGANWLAHHEDMFGLINAINTPVRCNTPSS